MDNFLKEINPTIKVLMLIVIIIPVTFSYDLYYAPSLVVMSVIFSWIFGGLSPAYMFKKLRGFLVGIVFLTLFLLFARGLGGQGAYSLFIFKWSKSDFIVISSIAFRMLLFAYTSLVFVETTDAVDLVLSLIYKWKVPYRIGYAFLVAYRFVPTFGEELSRIRIAHEARGVESGNTVIKSMINTPKYLIPLLINAIRKGERVAVAMDARAFGVYDDRTYYKQISSRGKSETIAFIVLIILVFGTAFIYYYLGLFSFRKSF